jgi:hypothetical protein
MGSPTSITSLPVCENLPCLAEDVLDLMKEGKSAQIIRDSIPAVLATDLGNCWARFVAGQDDRDAFTAAYEKVFQDYAAGYYNSN